MKATPAQVKVSVTISKSVHKALEMEKVLRGDSSITGIVAQIVDAMVRNRKMKVPLSYAVPDTEGEPVRPSVFLPETLYTRVCDLADKRGVTVPALLTEWVSAHFERRKVA